jgi:hypothetical protein
MQTHQQVVAQVGASNLHRALADRGVLVGSTTPQRWADRDNIPGEYWTVVSEIAGVSVDALAKAAARKRLKAKAA